MGGLVSLCTSRPNSRVPSKISLDPPDWADDEKSGRHARDVVERISKFCAPFTVDRSGMHTVNVFTADRLSEQKSLPPLFRRVSSLTPPIEGTASSLTEMWTAHRKELEVAIHKEKGKDHADPAPDLLSQEDRLRRRLSKLNMDMSVCRGDGNCLFRAISMELWGTEDYHLSVRRKAVTYMRENKDDFECYLGEDFALYTAKMERSGTWGDELTLRAICDVYGIIVNVVTSDQLNWFLRYMPKMLKHVKELFLTYISPVHYNTIRRKDSLRALRPSLSLTRKSIIQAAIDKADQALQEMTSIPEGPVVIEQRVSANVQSQSQPATPGALPPAPSAAAGPLGESMEPQSGAQQRIRSPFQEESSQSGQDLQVSGGGSASSVAVNGLTGVLPEQPTSLAARDSTGDSADERCLAGSNASSADGSIKDGFVLPGQVIANEVDSGPQQHASDSNNTEQSSAEKQQSLEGVKDVEKFAGVCLVGTSHDHTSTQALLSVKDRTCDKSTSRML